MTKRILHPVFSRICIKLDRWCRTCHSSNL